MTEEKNIKFNGRNLFYLESKKEENKKNLIMLHGYSFSSKDWERIGSMEHFSNMGYNVYAPDYPGFGKSEENPNFKIERGDIENSESFAQSFMEFMGIDKYTLIGASMGGGMAIMNTALFPDSVLRLVVVGPAWFNMKLLNQITPPTLFLWGQNDTVAPYNSMLDEIRKHKNFEIEIVENSGHPVYLDQTEKFFKIVDKFLMK